MRTRTGTQATRPNPWLLPTTAILLVATGLMLSGCNTTEGVGKDVSATGHAVTHAATDVKNGL